MRKPTVHLIGNTHFDPVWLWTWDEGMASIRSTIRSALARMDEDPDFRYSFSCPPVFRWIEETEPELFREIRRRVSEGRFCLDEGMWLQPDCFSASGESYARQCLYGQNYLKKTFGVRSDTAFNADCFGAPGMLPQILVKSGIPYAVFGRPDNADLPLSDPYFAWSSPDGSTVLACRITDAASPWSRDLSAEIDRAVDYGRRTGNDSPVIFGVTDHGGAPTKRDIAVIREKAREQAETGGALIRFSSTGDFFRACREAGRMPQDTVGEILIRFFGVFSDMPNVKKRNREAEYACLCAERAVLLNRALGFAPILPEKLNDCWEDVLFNQFHDILGGSSIRDAYDDAEARYGHAIHEAKTVLHTVLQRVTARIGLTDGETDWNLVVWNLHAFPVCLPIEAEVQWAWEFDWYRDELCVLDERGDEIPCQLLQAREAIPGFRSRFVFRAEIPSFGYRVFRVRRRKSSAELPGRLETAESEELVSAENEFVRLTVDRKTGALSLTEKSTGRTVREEPMALTDESDVWAFNFTGYGKREAFRTESVKLIESGDWRARIRVRFVYGFSALEQDFLLYRDSAEVECRFALTWRELHRTCKLRFTMPLTDQTEGKTPEILASSPYGTAERPLDGREKPVGPFLVLRQGDGSGFTLTADSLFAYDAAEEDGEAAVSLTAVRSPIWGDLRTEPLNPDWQYEGIGEGEYRGKWKLSLYEKEPCAGSLWDDADAFLCPSVVVDEANHPGTLPMRCSYAESDSGNGIRLTVLKPAEDGSGDAILRLMNPNAASGKTKVKLFGREAELSLAPWEIQTVRWGDEPEIVNILEEKSD